MQAVFGTAAEKAVYEQRQKQVAEEEAVQVPQIQMQDADATEALEFKKTLAATELGVLKKLLASQVEFVKTDEPGLVLPPRLLAMLQAWVQAAETSATEQVVQDKATVKATRRKARSRFR